MRMIETLVIFLFLFIILGSLSIPLWWHYAQPIIVGLPGYIEGVIRDIKNIIDLTLKSI